MVHDVYINKYPKTKDCVYQVVINKPDDDDLDTSGEIIGIFDILETAMHCLDIVSTYRSTSFSPGTKVRVVRCAINTMKKQETELIVWTREEGEHSSGVTKGCLILCRGLATQDINA